jgi:L-ascorbate metabolism protein UlaG (beta-lactamase superfamily)
MGPEEAAHATNMISPDYALPIHYGTFPVLTGDPEDYKAYTEEISEIEVMVPEAGDNFIT